MLNEKYNFENIFILEPKNGNPIQSFIPMIPLPAMPGSTVTPPSEAEAMMKTMQAQLNAAQTEAMQAKMTNAAMQAQMTNADMQARMTNANTQARMTNTPARSENFEAEAMTEYHQNVNSKARGLPRK